MPKQIIPSYPTLGQIPMEARVSYSSSGQELREEQLPDGTNSLSFDKSPWMPDNDPLSITVVLENTAPLTVPLRKVLANGATAGVALSWMSKGSLRSGVSSSVQLEPNNHEQEIELKLDFSAAELRDTLSYEIILFLASPSKKKSENHKCRIPGAILGKISDSHTIRADGKGSLFPVHRFEGKRTDSLWHLDCNWSDCTSDKFDQESVRVNINTNHPECPEEFKDDQSRRISPLTKTIIRDAIATMILHLKNQEGSDIWNSIKSTDRIDNATFSAGTVAHAIWHFYHQYTLNDETPSALMESCGRISV